MKTTMNTSWLRGRLATGFALSLLIAACGGSGGGDDNSSSTPTGTTPSTPTPPVAQANTMPVVIDAGPAALTATGNVAANILYATVTVCTPGSTTACRVIDHVQVDTGSTGLRLIASTLGSAVPTPITDPTTSLPLRECVRFADGYSYGSVGTADVTLGSRTIRSLPIHLIGDAAAGSAPASCVSGPQESDVISFGANGILGLGNFLQDCGSACVTRAVPASYYVCPASGCTPVTVALSRQVPNPVSLLTTDNNGVVVQLPAVSSPGATNVAGTVVFGIGTQADNALGSARIFKLAASGTFTTTANGTSFANSFIDSGSNANFFPANIATCADAPFFFCPVTTSGVPTSVTQSATINGTNGVSATVTFTVDNADQLFRTSDTAYPGLAGPNGSLLNGTGGGYDFGLPFFFGRNVYVVIEGNTVGGVTGPAVAF